MEIDFSDDAAEKAVRLVQARARRLLASFHRWADANPAAIAWMYAHSRDLARECKHSSPSGLFTDLREKSGIRINGDRTPKLANHHSPLVVRILIKSMPECAQVYRTKPSCYDLLDEADLPTFDHHGKLRWPQ